jgi:hypothetical protein
MRLSTIQRVFGQCFLYKSYAKSILSPKRLKTICIRFLFSEDLEPFLLSLNQYAKINRLEIAPMNMELSASTYLRFCASGAICASGVHLQNTVVRVSTLGFHCELTSLRQMLAMCPLHPRSLAIRLPNWNCAVEVV